MQIRLVPRDTENGHHDIYVNGDRKFCLRGNKVNEIHIRFEGKNSTDSIFTYSTVSEALNEIMEIITADYIIEAYAKAADNE